MDKNSAQGIILINKPRGITSFGVVSRLRKLTGIRRIGHCGTLDPFAEGMLPVCIGRATGAVQFMDNYDKVYKVTVEFGTATTTMDIEGEATDVHAFTVQELQALVDSDYRSLRQIVDGLPGLHQQTPPMYSAVKVDGKPLYKYAREGLEIERKSRAVTIFSAKIERIVCSPVQQLLRMDIIIHCSKGTYIRVIADEIGRKCGYFAHAYALVRLSCGPFDLSMGNDIEVFFDWSRQLPDQRSFVNLIQNKKILLPVDSAFSEYSLLRLDFAKAEKLIQGQPLDLDEVIFEDTDLQFDSITDQVRFAVYAGEIFIAVGRLTEKQGLKQLKTERVFIDLEDFRSIRYGNTKN